MRPDRAAAGAIEGKLDMHDAKRPVDPESLPYRPCVGVVLLNRDGLAFIGRRAGGEELARDHEWQMPQGGIDKGEEPLPAARRELHEETGIVAVTPIEEMTGWVTYDLPAELVGIAWKGRYRGQRQKWFAFRFDGDDAEIDVLAPPGGHTPEFAAWRWERLDRLPDLVVPFKRAAYGAVVAAFRHLAA